MAHEDREIVIIRVFDATPDDVWRAWTDPEGLSNWWGPKGFTTTTSEMSLRPGGEWRFVMHGPDGREYRNRVVYKEVVPAQRLVYAHMDDGESEPVSFQAHVAFEPLPDDASRTRLTLRMVFATNAERERIKREYGAVDGGVQTVGRLAEYLKGSIGVSRGGLTIALPSDLEIVIARVFEAPRRLVWDSMTQPEQIRKWLFSPPGWTMTECKDDVRVGGKFRWAWDGSDGAAMAMHGVYREVAPPERAVRTETFDFGCEAQAGEQLVTIALAEDGGRTSLTLTILFPSKEARDGMLASGMEQGLGAGYDNLDRLLVAHSVR